MKFSLSQKSQNSLIDFSKPADVDADLIAQLVHCILENGYEFAMIARWHSNV